MQVTPYNNSLLTKKQQVAAMFDNIAHKYDFLNHFLSAGIDMLWRREVVNVLKRTRPQYILDVATGTGDLAIAASRLNPRQILGVDISGEMLAVAKKKIMARNLASVIQLLKGDSENLLIDSNKFDAVTVGFGVRNFENLDAGLSEIYRVMKAGAIFVILEFSRPKRFPVKQLYEFYFKRICPLIGKTISRDNSAYSYLYHSVQACAEGDQMMQHLKKAGFKETTYRPLTFGIATIYTAVK